MPNTRYLLHVPSMPVTPSHNPVEPDTPNQKDPIHHPHRQDHPEPDHRDDEFPESEEDEDTDSDPWWMAPGWNPGTPLQPNKYQLAKHRMV